MEALQVPVRLVTIIGKVCANPTRTTRRTVTTAIGQSQIGCSAMWTTFHHSRMTSQTTPAQN